MIPPKTSLQPITACPAAVVLTTNEARYLNSLPWAEFEADTEPLGCDFAAHGPGARHAVCAQMQYTEVGDLALWWLLWDDDGHRELRMAPSCRKVVVNDTCLLVEGHPGDCDQDCGWTREQLRELLD